MSKEENRMKELILLLNEANEAYYIKNEEIMSNLAYDALYDELTQLEKTTGIVLEDSPTIQVGAGEVVTSLPKIAHEAPILSLDKTKNVHDLIDFLQEYIGMLSWKLDGLTVVLKYDKGQFVQGITRGNGVIGEDVSHTARTIVNIPLTIPYKKPLTVRGEAMISYSQFNKINEKLSQEQLYRNPRNLASGTMRQLDATVAKERKVHFFAFSMSSTEENAFFNDSKERELLWLQKQGFETVGFKMVDKENIADTVLWFENQIEQEDFGSDGLVLSIDSLEISESLGRTAKYPKDSIAFKWQDELATTTLEEVIWNTARTGVINPIAKFKPVELEGSIISRASVHNVSIFESLELGKGDEITVYKANMIIPQIAENLTRSSTCKVPKTCPSCGKEAKIDKENEVKILLCENIHCPAQMVHKIDHFASRDAMDIGGLSEQTIQKFIAKGFLSSYSDIYNLPKYKDEIINMPGFGKKSFNNLMTQIENSKKVPFHRFLYGVGIPHVGLATALLISEHFNHDENKILKATKEELLTIDGVGEVIAHTFVDFWEQKENVKEAKMVIQWLEKPKATIKMPQLLHDKTFVITGSLNKFENRKALEAFIQERGGRITSSVSKNTDYLINNDVESRSSKNKEAKEKNIPILSEIDFLKGVENETL